MTGMEGRVALVTGGSSGIGRATAILLAARGAQVMAVSHDAEQLTVLTEETGVAHCVASLEDPEGCAHAVGETRRRLGPVEILVSNAGRWFAEGPIWDQDPAEWRATMAINLDAAFLLTRACTLDMRQGGWGRVVMTSSTAGQLGAPEMAAYCASKHGLLGLMRSVAHDVGTFGGTCNAVLPGWVRTPMAEIDVEHEAATRSTSPELVWAEHDAHYPRGRVLEPEEIARVIVWLASDDATAVNGEAVTAALGGVW
ncbi:SDR family NAD(P)-dependent oxidoreductase [soil metagenome]